MGKKYREQCVGCVYNKYVRCLDPLITRCGYPTDNDDVVFVAGRCIRRKPRPEVEKP